MADNTIDYKVRIDTSSIADQLAQIRSQIEAAVSNASFAATNTAQGISGGVTMAQQQAMSFMNSTRLGMSQMGHDLASLRGTAGPQSFYSMGGMRLGWEAATGFGHNPHMSMTPGQYQREAQYAFGDRAILSTLNAIDFGAGASFFGGLGASALGMTGTAATMGAIAGALGPISLAAGGFMATMGADVTPTLRARAFIRDSSAHYLSGRFSGEVAGALGVNVAQAGRLSGAVGYEVSQNDAMGMVQQFAGMGGFDSVRTAEEFKDKVKILVENTRKYVQVLGVTQQEAMSMMKDVMNMGLAPTSAAAGSMAVGIAAQAYQAGYTPAAFSAFGMQSMEMMRGTGVGMGAAYLGGLNTLATARGMMQVGAMSPGLAAEYGGAAGAANRINQMGYNYGFSEGGLTWMAARNFYGQNPDGLFSQYSGAVTGLNSINSFMNFAGGLPRSIGQIGAGNLAMASASQYLNEFKMLQGGYPGLDFNEDTFSYYMSQRDPSMSAADRSLMFSMYRSAALGGASTAAGGYIGNRTGVQLDARPGVWSVAKDRFENAVASTLQTEQVAKSAAGLSSGFDSAMLGFKRANERGDILAGNIDVLNGVVTAGGLLGDWAGLGGLSSRIRGYGYDRRDLSAITFSASSIAAGLAKMNIEGGTLTEAQRLANAAKDALGVAPEQMVTTQYALAKVGIGTYSGADGVETASRDYSSLEAAAQSGNTRAQAIIATTSRAQYIAATNPIFGEGANRVRELLGEKAKGASVAVNVAKKYDDIIKDFDRIANTVSPGRASGDYQPEVHDFKTLWKTTGTGEDSPWLEMIGAYHKEGDAVTFSKAVMRAKDAHMNPDRAYEYGRSYLAYIKKLDAASVRQQSDAATVRLLSGSGQMMVKTVLEKAGINTATIDFTTVEGMQKAFQMAPKGLQDELARVAGSVRTIASGGDSAAATSDPQLMFHATAIGIQSEISKTLATMPNVDINNPTPTQMMEAGTNLMVSELRKLTGAVGVSGGAPALLVQVSSGKWGDATVTK